MNRVVGDLSNETNNNITILSFFKGVSSMNRSSITTLFKRRMGWGKKLPALLAAGALSALLSSCGDNVVENGGARPGDAANKKASVSIYVRDGVGGGNLSGEGVVVDFYGDKVYSVELNKGSKTNAYEVTAGGVVFKNIPVGRYSARVTKEGYATVFIDNIEIANNPNRYIGSGKVDSTSQDYYIPEAWSGEAKLYPLTGQLRGTLYYKLQSGKSAPVPEGTAVSVRIDEPQNIENRVFTATVGENGTFTTAKELPAIGTDDYTVIAQSFTTEEGLTFAPVTASSGSAILPGVVSSYGAVIFYTDLAKNYLILDYPNGVDAEGNIDITFESPIKASYVGSGSVKVTSSDGANSHPYVSSVRNGNTLRLAPIGNWLRDKLGAFLDIDAIQVIFTGFTAEDGSSNNDTLNITITTQKLFLVDLLPIVIADSTSDVVLRFSEDLDDSQLTAAYGLSGSTINVTDPEGKSFTYDVSGNTLTVSPGTKWIGSTVSVALEDLKSVNGFAFSGIIPITVLKPTETFQIVSEITEHLINKEIWLEDSLSPIEIKFNQPVDISKITSYEAIVGNQYAVSYRWSNGNRTLTLTPDNPWSVSQFKTGFALTFGSQFKSTVDGTTLQNAAGWSVWLSDLKAAFVVTRVNGKPFVVGQGVKLDSTTQHVVIDFNASVDKAVGSAISGTSFAVKVGASAAAALPVGVAFSNGDSTITISRPNNFPWSDKDTVYLSNAISTENDTLLASHNNAIELGVSDKLLAFDYIGPRGSDKIFISRTDNDAEIALVFNDKIDEDFVSVTHSLEITPAQPWTFTVDEDTLFVRPADGWDWTFNGLSFDIKIKAEQLRSVRPNDMPDTLKSSYTVTVEKEVNNSVDGKKVTGIFVDTIAAAPLTYNSIGVWLIWNRVLGSGGDPADGYIVSYRANNAGSLRDLQYVSVSGIATPTGEVATQLKNAKIDNTKVRAFIRFDGQLADVDEFSNPLLARQIIDSTFEFYVTPTTDYGLAYSTRGDLSTASAKVFARPTLEYGYPDHRSAIVLNTGIDNFPDTLVAPEEEGGSLTLDLDGTDLSDKLYSGDEFDEATIFTITFNEPVDTAAVSVNYSGYQIGSGNNRRIRVSKDFGGTENVLQVLIEIRSGNGATNATRTGTITISDIFSKVDGDKTEDAPFFWQFRDADGNRAVNDEISIDLEWVRP